MTEPYAIPRRRRRWPLFLVVLLLIVFGGLWAVAGIYGPGFAGETIAAWKAREARAGRVYTCATQTIGGLPFGLDVRCADAGAELKSNAPPLTIKAKDILLSLHIWRPTVLNAEFAGPVTIAEARQPPMLTANWQKAQAQIHGLPSSLESFSLNLKEPTFDRPGVSTNLFKAGHADLDGRLVSGTVQDHPVIELILKLAAASAPSWHQAAVAPVDADITAVLRGLKDFAPKPLPQRLRELQAAGGRIEITRARVQQRDTIATATGALGLSQSGRLNGTLELTVANLDQFLPTLGLDRMLSPEQASPQLNKTFSALDKLMPGLGNVARQNAAPMINAGVNLMGQPAELEGKRAVKLPLRFDDGVAFLGPLKLGAVPPLY
jgi:hypothetical protein